LQRPPIVPEVQVASVKPLPNRAPYTISGDGHFIGHDGFIVPRSVEEFIDRYPRYVRDRVRLRWRHASAAEREDYESELLIFLMTLPKDSKFRTPGYNGFPQGCKDRVQTFSPDDEYGASGPCFFYYLKVILTNHFNSLWAKTFSDPIRRHGTLNLYSSDHDENVIDESYLYMLTGEVGALGMSYDRLVEVKIFVDEFVAYVGKHNPELVRVIKVIQTADTLVEAQHALGLTERFFARARTRLMTLSSCLCKGTEPPRQRTVYRSRSSSRII
jgi:hypothetical protein